MDWTLEHPSSLWFWKRESLLYRLNPSPLRTAIYFPALQIDCLCLKANLLNLSIQCYTDSLVTLLDSQGMEGLCSEQSQRDPLKCTSNSLEPHSWENKFSRPAIQRTHPTGAVCEPVVEGRTRVDIRHATLGAWNWHYARRKYPGAEGKSDDNRVQKHHWRSDELPRLQHLFEASWSHSTSPKTKEPSGGSNLEGLDSQTLQSLWHRKT